MNDVIGSYVYLIKAVGTGFYKIGHTINVSSRLKQLSNKFAPQELRIIHTFPCPGWGGGPEYRLHQWFLHKSVHWADSRFRNEKEWFVLDEEDVEFIKGIHVKNCRQQTPGVGPINVGAADPLKGKSIEWLSLRYGKGRHNPGLEGEEIVGKEEEIY